LAGLEDQVNQAYLDFLARKAPRAASVGMEPAPMPAHLFDFQAHCVEFALRKGRAALFEDTGLGKTRQEHEFLRQAAAATNGCALLLTELAVARQIEAEGLALGYNCRVIREMADVRPGTNICNYDRLDKLDAAAFGAVALDESDILKSFTGVTTRKLIRMFSDTRFRLCATATPAPNDHMELGQHAEFLGIMASNEMLARWFISDQTEMGRYRLKRHGEDAFWDWMASWSRCAESPEDLGFDGTRFVLPEMKIIRHRVIGDVRRSPGSLFVNDLSATNMHTVKRQTSEGRASAVAALVAAESDEAWLLWVDTDYEADAMLRLLPTAIDVRGSQSPERKEEGLLTFLTSGRPLVSKPSLAGRGMNYQHCARMAFVGRSFSYAQWYQAVRRCWRFGQKREVHVHLAVGEGEEQIGRTIDRKAGDHATMKRAMADAMRRDMARHSEVKVVYNPTHEGRIPAWLTSSAA
jgi:hypothetical protein